MADRRFDAVLFDLTGVLTTSPFKNLAAMEVEHGLDEGALVTLMLGDYGADGDDPWHQVERGELAFRDYFAGFAQRLTDAGHGLDPVAVLRSFGGLTPHPQMIERVRRLRTEGYATALVTNNVAEFRDGWAQLVPVDELFDVITDSSEARVRKPNPRIFELTLERLGGVAADRAVFLDDHPGCVAGARAAGLTAIHVDDPDAAIAALDELLAG